MIRVLIVEDEPQIARALAQLVSMDPFFEVAASVINGREALDTLETEDIDIVFTDIRMPVMDGIELLRNLDRDYPNIFSVIISGYRDFDYAKAALGYRAFDYILKPLSKAKISELLDRLKDEYLRRSRENRWKLVQRSLAGEIVNSGNNPDCLVAVLCAGALSSAVSDLFSPGQAFWSNRNLDEILEKLSDGAGAFFVFNGAYKAEKVIISDCISLSEGEAIFRRLYMELADSGKMPVTLLCHFRLVTIGEIYKTLGDLNKALYNEIKLYRSRLIFSDFNKRPPPPSAAIDDGIASKVTDAVLAQDAAGLKEALASSLAYADKQKLTQREYLAFLTEILNNERLAVIDSLQSSVSAQDLEDAVTNSITHESLCDDLVSILISGFETAGKADGKKSMKDIVEEIEKYLIANYNTPISHDMLAEKFDFVPSYISRIFRKYKAVSPSEFLTKYRITMAKEIMDNNPYILVRDVASKVGYNDPFYFSKIFKKETNIWPKDYLNQSAPGSEKDR